MDRKDIENAIDSNFKIEIIEVLKNYLTEVYNENFDAINKNFSNIKSKLDGLKILGINNGRALNPSATDPSDAKQYDWYYNTATNWFRMFANYGNGDEWKDILEYKVAVAHPNYYTKNELSELFEAKTYEFDVELDIVSLTTSPGLDTWSIVKPIDTSNVPSGVAHKLLLKEPAGIKDESMILYGNEQVYENYHGTLLTWGKIKQRVEDGDRIIIQKRVGDSGVVSWHLYKWIDVNDYIDSDIFDRLNSATITGGN